MSSNAVPTADVSDEDSFCCETPEPGISVALTSPTKRSQRNHKRRSSSANMTESYNETVPSNIVLDRRTTVQSRSNSLISAGYDPFKSSISNHFVPLSSPDKSRRPTFQRKSTFGFDSRDITTREDLGVSRPMREVSGNSKSTLVGKLKNEDGQLVVDENPFQWYQDAAKESHRNMGSKGHLNQNREVTNARTSYEYLG